MQATSRSQTKQTKKNPINTLKSQRYDYITNHLMHLTFRYIYGLCAYKATADFRQSRDAMKCLEECCALPACECRALGAGGWYRCAD